MDTLAKCLQAAQVTGGIVEVPCVGSDNSTGNFYLQNSTMNPSGIALDTSSKSGSIFVFGYGGATTLLKQDAGDLFVLTNQYSSTRGTNPSGMTFSDIQIQYATTVGSGAGFNGTNADNLLLRRVFFQNCPTAVTLMNTLEATMVSCTAEFGSAYANASGTVLILGGSGGGSSGCEQFTMDKCLLRQSVTLVSTDSILGIVIQEATHGHFSNTSINGFTTGVTFNPSAKGGGSNTHVFNNVDINLPAKSQYAVLIQPTAVGVTAPGSVQNIKFVECDFDTSSADPLAAVYINANSPTGGTVDGVELIGCSASGFNGPAIYLADAVHIEVIGGIYTNNAQTGTPKGQISLLAPSGASVKKVNIVGATCTGISGGSNQYGIVVATGSDLVYIRDCNLGNNGSGAINFGSGLSSTATIQVTNCAGYNDQGTPVYSGVPISSAHQSASANGYYGPSLLTCKIGSSQTIQINSQSFTPVNNAFFTIFLNSPNETILFTTATGVTLTWRGE